MLYQLSYTRDRTQNKGRSLLQKGRVAHSRGHPANFVQGTRVLFNNLVAITQDHRIGVVGNAELHRHLGIRK